MEVSNCDSYVGLLCQKHQNRAFENGRESNHVVFSGIPARVNYDNWSCTDKNSLVFYTPKNYVRTFGTKRIRHREA